MAPKHQLHHLIEWENGYIGYCPCCRTYNVAFMNSLFVLKTDEYAWFQQMLANKSCMAPLYTTHGKEVMLRTPMSNYFVLFTYDELDELLEKMTEASPLIQAHAILNNGS